MREDPEFDRALQARGLVRRDPGIWFAPRQSAISYPEQGNALCLSIEDISFWFRHRNRCILEIVRRFQPGERFLDIGGGNGFVARGLQQAGIPCALLEPGIAGALAAHARGIDPVICATLEDAGLPEGSFAAAGLFDVIEHVADDLALLARVSGVLKPGGRLFATVPAYQALFSADDTAAGHFRRYALDDFCRLLDRAGFTVDLATYIFAPLPLPILLLRTIPSWFGRDRGIDPEQATADHSGGSISGRILDALLNIEFALLKRGRRIPFGGTCLVAAHRR
jgi:SAM-dependent methyltransferase